MGRLGFEPRTNRLKAECSTAELATPKFTFGVIRNFARTMGRLGFEPRTNRLKAECSTAELATPMVGKEYVTLTTHSTLLEQRLSNGLILYHTHAHLLQVSSFRRRAYRFSCSGLFIETGEQCVSSGLKDLAEKLPWRTTETGTPRLYGSISYRT
jgi:hypothetical protein